MLIIIDTFTCFEKKLYHVRQLRNEFRDVVIQEKLPHAVVTPSQERHKIIKVMTRDIEFGQMEYV